MSYQPDDPSNPLRRKPPKLPFPNPELNFMQRCNKRYTRAAWTFIEGKGPLEPEIKTFMLLAFISEVGMPATEVVLCERKQPDGKMMYWFEPRMPMEPTWKQEFRKVQTENESLRNALQKAQTELIQIKEKGQR